MNDKRFVIDLSKRVRDAGGRVFFVGGCVRDALMGVKDIKDLDIEVYGILPEQLRDIARQYGEIRTQGASFGILNIAGHHVDIAQPRTEKATGRGHKDFDVYVDPFIPPERAAARRDFTMNAIMRDVLTGEIVDPFGGVGDIHKQCIRHVREDSFVEDPLRVLRAAQFAARFGFTVFPETIALCRKIDLSALPRERISGELDKALTLAPFPSVFFTVLREMGQLSLWFPELKGMIGAPQDPSHHPEGDVWAHTMLVLDAAAGMREMPHDRAFLLAALCHDMGKPAATEYHAETGRYTAYGHDQGGKAIAEAFIDRIYHEKKLSRYVSNLTALHITPRLLLKQGASDEDFMRLFDRCVCPEDLIDLVYCDGIGRYVADEKSIYAHSAKDGSNAWNVLLEREGERRERLKEKLSIYEKLMQEPEVRGDDLIRMGYAPGVKMGEMLDFAHALHLSGMQKDAALERLLERYGEPPGND